MNTRASQGFTLVEVILALAVAVGVALAVFSTFQLIESVRVRQEQAGIVTWESELVLARIRNLVAQGFEEPLRQESGDELVLTGGGAIRMEREVLTYAHDGIVEPLSSADVRISSLSFQNLGTDDTPSILKVGFTVSTLSSESRQFYGIRIDTSIYE